MRFHRRAAEPAHVWWQEAMSEERLLKMIYEECKKSPAAGLIELWWSSASGQSSRRYSSS